MECARECVEGIFIIISLCGFVYCIGRFENFVKDYERKQIYRILYTFMYLFSYFKLIFTHIAPIWSRCAVLVVPDPVHTPSGSG